MIVETVLVFNLNYLDSEILKPKIEDLSLNNRYVIAEQEEKMSRETEQLFQELFKILDQQMLENIQKQ
jgi:hypothetical protein